MSLNDSLADTPNENLSIWETPVSEDYSAAFININNTGFEASFESALKRVKHSETEMNKEAFALIADELLVDFAIATDCELRKVGKPFCRKAIALGLRKHSQLKDILDPIIIKLKNTRKIEQLYKKWWINDRVELQKSRYTTIYVQQLSYTISHPFWSLFVKLYNGNECDLFFLEKCYIEKSGEKKVKQCQLIFHNLN
ncbi:glutamate receptor ionotropic: kainate 2-like protein [Leptotrombidium deliense]|uniref:Glutamate receptor ionotropic: kainate 2-like protein n=1 Tax=Leptotrombidium deliense TaxID=299467 RepID=A0A443SFS9_9ACAR|nr:glutamate receptor ionotropic: kainate 2-like protein [Leptotrombidium deliense]